MKLNGNFQAFHDRSRIKEIFILRNSSQFEQIKTEKTKG